MAASPAIQPANDPQDFVSLAQQAAEGAKALVAEATQRVKARVAGPEGKLDAGKLEREQHAAHGLAWLTTYGEAVRELADYAARLQGEGQFGETEALLVKIGMGEYLDQMFFGIPMSQGEMVRPTSSLGFTASELSGFRNAAIETITAEGNTAENRAALVAKIREATRSGAATIGASGLDEDMEAIRSEMRRFGKAEVVDQAHEWHLKNDYIPMEIVAKMAELGVFGLTIPEEYGGMGMPKAAMCVVSEELSRAYIGVGSLGTRSEIAAELILCGGTEEQKQRFLPGIASGDILPTAVFTEPNTGSDLASLRTKAVKDGDVWKISGNKTWITHPVRADIMTVLVRTKPEEKGHRGLSMLIAEKPRGTDEEPFPVQGLTGGEIEVLGYRGMKEYELSFENFEVPGGNLLGEVEGKGFAQLMQTFESARIQTAARAIGVAQSALDIGLRYAEERVQFGKALVEFPRVADKIAMMAVEINIARQLTYFSAREKDEGKRCDLEAGMAKLLGARVAWAAADNALQIHGGNGFALEYQISRVLCDARILSIFEGAAEIQAQVIARRLLEQ
ncbi:acyl-CoA dehydrogenase family protein [Methylorubrum suomiense]|uniref:(2S)-methylsuccinyl-CoA dehydrogenase n=1 Tax=Methylorubrum suomiense TaxID=144191 RepID=A0ABQ4V1J5_9HYPH|nr:MULTISPECIES: acyl-CoA dehydrogenase family protein [Methylobacteriaceae]GJE78333.1 (2S)-methylsuccinyl-CoA dehydrogenase [Methylorubrum suomiense]